jgi:hypothetical protein
LDSGSRKITSPCSLIGNPGKTIPKKPALLLKEPEISPSAITIIIKNSISPIFLMK